MEKIILQFNGITLKEIPINKETISIGRERDNDIIIDNLAVSRQHARLVHKGNKFILEDLNSSNGTFLNEKKIDTCELNEGDTVLIGKHSLIFLKENEVGVRTVEPQPVDETYILDTKKHREILEKNLEHKTEEEKKVKEFKGMIYYLLGNGDIKEIKLKKRVTVIGKGDNADIRVKGLFVGKSTLLVNKKPDGFYISRGDGKRSPRLNGAPIKGQIRLKDNDFIDVGSIKMCFSINDS